MNYTASVTDFFKSPKWMMNMLLAGLCLLIPIVGQIVVMGWLVTGFWGRDDKKPETFPAFNFEEFGKYLERGLWPFLAVLVAAIVLVPVMFILMVPIMFLGGLLAGHQGTGSDTAGAIVGITMALFYLVMTMLLALVIVPLKLRASLTQDFAKSFNFAFMMRFIALTWKEIIVAWLFLLVASIGLTIVGALVFCVGIYFAMVVSYFAWTHLYSQLYLLYLSRGGEPVPRSPKLIDGPPPLTAA